MPTPLVYANLASLVLSVTGTVTRPISVSGAASSASVRTEAFATLSLEHVRVQMGSMEASVNKCVPMGDTGPTVGISVNVRMEALVIVVGLVFVLLELTVRPHILVNNWLNRNVRSIELLIT